MKTLIIPKFVVVSVHLIFIITVCIGLAQARYATSELSGGFLVNQLLEIPLIQKRFEVSEHYSPGYGNYYLRNLIVALYCCAAHTIVIIANTAYQLAAIMTKQRDARAKHRPKTVELKKFAFVALLLICLMLWASIFPVINPAGSARSSSYQGNFGFYNFLMLNSILFFLSSLINGMIFYAFSTWDEQRTPP